MKKDFALLILTALLFFGALRWSSPAKAEPKNITIIGHRGASGLRPEHTLESYWLAIQEGADFVEPDLVSTKDGVLVARHENEISQTTDVTNHAEFAHRMATKTIDGMPVTGWFTEDFTLAELKTLRAKERLPALRGTQFDGQFQIPTLQEIIDLVRTYNSKVGDSSERRVGIYPETKHSSYFQSIGLPLEKPLVQMLSKNGYTTKNDLVFIQSFETSNLKEMSRMTSVNLIQLIDASGQPYDFAKNGDSRTYADMVKPEGLREIATYADGIGVNLSLILPRDGGNHLLPPTALVRDAHEKGLIVHGWTFRAENTFLPIDFRVGTNPNLLGDLPAAIERFLSVGMDGFFTDFPGIGHAARDAFLNKR